MSETIDLQAAFAESDVKEVLSEFGRALVDRMTRFFSSNPIFRSRIAHHVGLF